MSSRRVTPLPAESLRPRWPEELTALLHIGIGLETSGSPGHCGLWSWP